MTINEADCFKECLDIDTESLAPGEVPDDFQASKYPDEIDNNQNLFLVHDSLRVVLTEDYDPNDPIVANRTKVTVSGDTTNFPPTGIITLTEQCSEPVDRAISFFYTLKTDTTFEGLVLLSGFKNNHRAKNITNVTENVMAQHHNALKDALIAIETFAGIKGTCDLAPFGATMEGRINFLRCLVLSPRAWFTADKHVGLVPLTVTFNNESFRIGDCNVIFTWDFGDQSSLVSLLSVVPTISVDSNVPEDAIDVSVIDIDGGTIIKTYTTPGNYAVTLRVENCCGVDVVEFEDFINVRIEAPIEATINFSSGSSQIVTAGLPVGGPFDPETPPTIRSRINKFINISIPDGVNPSTLRTFSGEEIQPGDVPVDPIETYTWSLTDDLSHANEKSTQASYSIGGLYDLALRVDTSLGAYRITTYTDAIDIIEQRSLWLFTDDGTSFANEFGLISETFKSGNVPYSILKNPGFLTGTNNEVQAKREFQRNTGFAINGAIDSGDHGIAVLAYAAGGTGGDSGRVKFVEFEGFAETFIDSVVTFTGRPWNWIFLPFSEKAYFLLGADSAALPNQNLSNQVKDTITLGGIALEAPVTLTQSNYLNGAEELIQHPTSSFDAGEPLNGRFAVYRSAVKDSTGYFLRNDSVGTFFKIRDFYQTEGTTVDPVVNIRRLADMAGPVKVEGQLVALTNGIFFFNNSGSISAFNTVNGVWETGSSTTPFSVYQDTTVDGFSDADKTLLAASDGDRTAYLSYDYSVAAFIKYNSIEQVFFALSPRGTGTQWIMDVY